MTIRLRRSLVGSAHSETARPNYQSLKVACSAFRPLPTDRIIAPSIEGAPPFAARTEREHQGANPLRILKADPTGVRVVNAKLVGHYAIQLDWSDGHNTGIFDFRFLRSLGVVS